METCVVRLDLPHSSLLLVTVGPAAKPVSQSISLKLGASCSSSGRLARWLVREQAPAHRLRRQTGQEPGGQKRWNAEGQAACVLWLQSAPVNAAWWAGFSRAVTSHVLFECSGLFMYGRAEANESKELKLCMCCYCAMEALQCCLLTHTAQLKPAHHSFESSIIAALALQANRPAALAQSSHTLKHLPGV